jgi:hypothetical protein
MCFAGVDDKSVPAKVTFLLLYAILSFFDQAREALTNHSFETKSCPSEAEGGASSFCQVFFGYFL